MKQELIEKKERFFELFSEDIDRIAEEYGFDVEEVKEYLERLLEYECVTEEIAVSCLETMCSIRSSILSYSNPDAEDYETSEPTYNDTIEYAVNDAIYTVLEDRALPFLANEYKEYRGITPSAGMGM